jgi:hypothetical protein
VDDLSSALDAWEEAEAAIATGDDADHGATIAPEAPTPSLDVKATFRARIHRNGSINPEFSVVLVAPRANTETQMDCLLRDATGEADQGFVCRVNILLGVLVFAFVLSCRKAFAPHRYTRRSCHLLPP